MRSAKGDENQTQITTVIPTYRRPHLLLRAIASVRDQDYENVRILVCDNASGDETAAVVAGQAQADPRINYHCHAENKGAAENFEFGLRSVETPFFSILSDDDYLLPGFYSRAMEDLSRHPEAMFWAGVTLNVDEGGTIWDARVDRWPREGLFEPPAGAMQVTGGMSPTWTGIVFRRDVLDAVGMPDKETLGPSDLDFVIKIAARYPFLLYKTPAAVFTLNSSAFSATQPLSSFWPGWQKMFQNIRLLPGLEEPHRAALLEKLHADARRMLFRRGLNALAAGRHAFARDAGLALASAYSGHARAMVLRCLALACERIPLAQSALTWVYRLSERLIVRSRRQLQARFGYLVRTS